MLGRKLVDLGTRTFLAFEEAVYQIGVRDHIHGDVLDFVREEDRWLIADHEVQQIAQELEIRLVAVFVCETHLFEVVDCP